MLLRGDGLAIVDGRQLNGTSSTSFVLTDAEETWWVFVMAALFGALIAFISDWVSMRTEFSSRNFSDKAVEIVEEGSHILLKVVNIRKVLESINHTRGGHVMKKKLRKKLDENIQELLDKFVNVNVHNPAWLAMEHVAKGKVVDAIVEHIPETTSLIVRQISDTIDSNIDLNHFVVESIRENPEKYARIIRDAARPGINAVVRAGAIIGAVLGLLCALIYLVVDLQAAYFLTPLCGAIVGISSAFIALWMISQPIETLDYSGRLVCQDYSVNAQEDELSEDLVRQFHDIVKSDNIWEKLQSGPHAEYVDELIGRYTKEGTDRILIFLKPFIEPSVEDYDAFKIAVETLALTWVVELIQHMLQDANDSLDLENQIRIQIHEIPVSDIEKVLKQVFFKDVWKTISIGAAIGLFFGGVQSLVLFLALQL